MRQHFDHVDSTQRVAVELARAGAPPGAVVIADRQESGRGRLDHRWESPVGGLYLSTILPAAPPADGLLPLAMGSSVATALRPFSARPWLKWPNDLLVVEPPRPPRKLGGVIVDVVANSAGTPVTVVGVGINVDAPSSAYPSDLRGHLVQLSELAGRPVRIEEVERAVVPALFQAAERLAHAGGRQATVETCRTQLYGWGQPVTVDGTPAGLLEGLEDDGAVVLAQGERRTRVVAGDLRVEFR